MMVANNSKHGVIYMTVKRTYNRNFVDGLRALMKRRGITQQQLADDLKITRKTVSLWCIGRGYPDPYNMEKLIKYFNIPENFFDNWEDFFKQRENWDNYYKDNFIFEKLEILENIEKISNKKFVFMPDEDEWFSMMIDMIVDYAWKIYKDFEKHRNDQILEGEKKDEEKHE